MSEEDPSRWADGGGPPGALELVRAIERTPPAPAMLRPATPRHVGARRMFSGTRLIGGAIATLAVVGGLALWFWPRPPRPVVVREPVAREVVATAPPAIAAHPEPIAPPPTVAAPIPRVGQSVPAAVRPDRAPDAEPLVIPSRPAFVTRPDALAGPPAVAPFDAELSASQVREVVQRNRPGLQRCYEVAARDTGATEPMRANIEVAVGGNGNVTRASVTAPSAPAQFATCVGSQVRRWRFPAGGTVAFPVVFAPDTAEQVPVYVPGTDGYLSINTFPVSRIFVDARDTGRYTPVARLSVRAGQHRVGFQTLDGAMTEITVEVRADQTTRLTRQLPIPTPVVESPFGAELSAAQLRTVVQRNRPGLQHCYEAAARETHSSEPMRANIDFAAGSDGVVTRANVTLGPGAPGQLADCIAEQVRGWRFPAAGEASFPIVFSPGG